VSAILLLFGIILLTLCGGIQIIIFTKRYKAATPSKALVIHGKLEPKYNKGVKVIQHGRTFIWPIIQDFHYQSTEAISISQKAKYSTADNVTIEVEAKFMAKPDILPDRIEIFVHSFWNLSESETIKRLCSEIDVIMTQTVLEHHSKETLNDLKGQLKSNIQDRFHQLAVTIPNGIAVGIR